MKISKLQFRKMILELAESESPKRRATPKIRISKRQLKKLVKEETSRLLKEEEEDEAISATDFVKAMKEDLPSMMKLVPDALNDELMGAIRALVAASKYDTSGFKAAIKVVMAKTEKAQAKIEDQS